MTKATGSAASWEVPTGRTVRSPILSSRPETSSPPPSQRTSIRDQVPAVAHLLDHFHFLPDWRFDDVMVSFAADQGSVGPHVDDYDVFLYQAKGKRRWQIHSQPVSQDDFIPGLDLRILPEFETEQEWLLGPGDMLYLPPNLAHWGIAEGECMTCSVGFRAPACLELLAKLYDAGVLELPDDRD